MSLSATSMCLLNTSRDGDSTTSMGSLTTLSVKEFFLISSLSLPWCNLRPCSVSSHEISDTATNNLELCFPGTQFWFILLYVLKRNKNLHRMNLWPVLMPPPVPMCLRYFYWRSWGEICQPRVSSITMCLSNISRCQQHPSRLSARAAVRWFLSITHSYNGSKFCSCQRILFKISHPSFGSGLRHWANYR